MGFWPPHRLADNIPPSTSILIPSNIAEQDILGFIFRTFPILRQHIILRLSPHTIRSPEHLYLLTALKRPDPVTATVTEYQDDYDGAYKYPLLLIPYRGRGSFGHALSGPSQPY